MSVPPDPPPPRPVLPPERLAAVQLGYARDDGGTGVIAAQAVGGFFATIFYLGLGTVVSLMIAARPSGGSLVAFALFALLFLVGAVWAAVASRRYYDKRGWAIGIWIGIAVYLLMWGACGVILLR